MTSWPLLKTAQPPPPPPPIVMVPVKILDGGSITTPFGVPGSWQMGIHPGDDWNTPDEDYGKPIHSACAGTVLFAGRGGWGDPYGIHVIVSRANRHRVAHCHLSALRVHTGQTVKAGQILGLVGETGRTFGAHCHVEERVSPYQYARSDVRKPVYDLVPAS